MSSLPPNASHAQRAIPCDLALAEVAKNPSATEIYLGRRALIYVSDLTRYKQLQALWLNDNSLTALHGFDCNPTLQAIYAHNNGIYTLAGSLQNVKYLRSLSLYNNKLRDLKATLPYIRHLQYLVALDLFDNPLANEPNYRCLIYINIYNIYSVVHRNSAAKMWLSEPRARAGCWWCGRSPRCTCSIVMR
jgi:Leucine-rich repeat (LRR) protein